MSEDVTSCVGTVRHSLAKEQDTVGVLAPNILVASSFELFSFSSVSTPCRVNQADSLNLNMFMDHTQTDHT